MRHHAMFRWSSCNSGGELQLRGLSSHSGSRLGAGRAQWSPILLLAAFCMAHAGEDSWTRVGMGGNVKLIAVCGSRPEVLWGASDQGYILRSPNRGLVWERRSRYLNSVRYLDADPTEPEILYVQCDHGWWGTDFWKTTDGGGSWTWLDRHIGPLAINPANSNFIYMASQDGVRKSHDGGHEWRLVRMLDSRHEGRCICLDSVHPRTVYVGTESGIYRSTNGGATWGPAGRGLPNSGRRVWVNAIRARPSREGTLYAATNKGIYRTTNGGDRWERLDTGTASPDVTWLATTPSDGRCVYATTAAGETLISHDGGTTWITSSVTGASGVPIADLDADPAFPGTLYSCLETWQDEGVSGLFKSTDTGVSWSLVGKGLPPPSVRQLVVSQSRGGTAYAVSGLLLKIRGGGACWSPISDGLPTDIEQVVSHPVRPRTLFVRTSLSLYRSSDEGESWEEIHLGPLCEDCYTSYIAIDPLKPGRLVAVIDEVGLIESLDLGDNWQKLSSGLSAVDSVEQLVFDPHHPGTIYAVVGYGGDCLRVSTDDGRTWEPFVPRAASDGFSVDWFAADPEEAGLVWIVANSNVYQGKVGGDSWELVFPRDGEEYFAEQLAFDPLHPGNVYVGTSEGVFRSNDSGATWRSWSKGLYEYDDSKWVPSIASDQALPVLYAGTFGGLYARTIGR